MLLGQDLAALGEVVEGAGDVALLQTPPAGLQHLEGAVQPGEVEQDQGAELSIGFLRAVVSVDVIAGSVVLVLQLVVVLEVQLGELGGGGHDGVVEVVDVSGCNINQLVLRIG